MKKSNDNKLTFNEICFDKKIACIPLQMETIKPYSNKNFWFVCNNGHFFIDKPIYISNRKVGCKACLNKEKVVGVDPILKHEWSCDNDENPMFITVGSDKPVWWVCNKSKDHKWLLSPSQRHNRRNGKLYGCPFCSNRRVLRGFNDLATTHPETASLWFSGNKEKPTNVVAGSNKKVWWMCKSGHKWQRQIAEQVKIKNQCAKCANFRVAVKGKSDLFSVHPELKYIWHSKNKINPDEITFRSNKKVWWICENEHEWESRVADIAKGNRCPKCSKSISIVEKKIADALSKKFILEHQPAKINGRKPDILIKEKGIKIVLEVDGFYWHSPDASFTKDIEQTKAFLEEVDFVIRVRNENLKPIFGAINVLHPYVLKNVTRKQWWNPILEILEEIIKELLEY